MLDSDSRPFIPHRYRRSESNITNFPRKCSFNRSIFITESFSWKKSFSRNTLSYTTHELYLVNCISTLHSRIAENSHRIYLIKVTHNYFTIGKPVLGEDKLKYSCTNTYISSMCCIYNSTIFISCLKQRNIPSGRANYIPIVFRVIFKLLNRELVQESIKSLSSIPSQQLYHQISGLLRSKLEDLTKVSVLSQTLPVGESHHLKFIKLSSHIFNSLKVKISLCVNSPAFTYERF